MYLGYKELTVIPVILIFFIHTPLIIAQDTGDDIYNQDYWESKLAVSIPSLKIMKRQIRHFKSGHDASVTIIYQSNQPVNVRWFTLDTNLPYSEVPNMRPIEGDESFEITQMSSGYVTAVTLTLPRFHEIFPLDFETVLTTEDGSKQFQLKTVVRQRTEIELHNINSPEWLLLPNPVHRLKSFEKLHLFCAVLIPKELRSGFTNELTMYHTSSAKQQRDQTDVFEVVTRMHSDTPDITENQDSGRLVVGRRYNTLAGHSIYRVGFTTSNATSDLGGVYQCGVERQNDRLFAIATVVPSSSSSSSSSSTSSSLNTKLNVDILSCERDNYDSKKKILTLKDGHSTCFRCRATGWPRPKVALYRIGNNSVQTEVIARKGLGIGVRAYTNVADGGVAEAAYGYTRLRAGRVRGNYSCVAVSKPEGEGAEQTKTIYFQIVVV